MSPQAGFHSRIARLPALFSLPARRALPTFARWRWSSAIAVLAATACILSPAGIVIGQSVSEKPSTDEVTIEIVQNRLKQFDQTAGLSEAQQQSGRELYQQALQELDSAKTWVAKAAASEQRTSSAPRDLDQSRSDPGREPTSAVPGSRQPSR